MKSSPFVAARTALAVAACAALAGAPFSAQALGLGRLNVQSALGEGMRADIDITSLTPEEAATLQVRVASPEVYRSAGVDYNAVLTGTQVVVNRRADGRASLRVSSDRAVQEPFVEVILELTWANGRLVREFTMLFDPPGSRVAPPVQAAAPVAPVMSAAPPAAGGGAPLVATAPPAPRAAPKPAARQPAAEPAAPAPMPAPAPRPAPMPVARAEAGADQVAVKPGDSLSGIAARTRRPGVALDQMLVGLYRANPDAFFAENINRLRAGAVLSVPPAEAMRGITRAEARQVLLAQSSDFGGYRNKLAQAAPQVPAQEAAQKAKGQVQAAVEDRKATAPAPDKLKLSAAPAAASKPAPVEPPSAKDTAARVAELTRNLEELKKLQQGAVAAQAPAAPALPVPASAAPAPVAASVPPAAPVVAAAPASGLAASAPVVLATAPPVKPPAPLPVPEASGGGLLDGPWLPIGGGLLAVIAAGFAAWKLKSRFAKPASETSFLESRMQPDSFFGASGGQRVDTREAAATGASSMGYSLSQLDAIGDVDPVAEADVYLAYGRDLQAEEILKEALRATPDRLSVRTKLLEVYAKRRDAKGYELLATQLYALTNGQGPDWDKAQEMGRGIDADNQLYQPGGHPEEIILDGQRVVVEPLGASTLPASVLSPPTQPMERAGDHPLPGDSRLDLDLDLDLDLGASEPTQPAALMDLPMPAAMGTRTAAHPRLDFDFADPPTPAPLATRTASRPTSVDSMAMDFDPGTISPASLDGETLVDFGDFGNSAPAPLDGDDTTAAATLPDLPPEDLDPMARKLELAEEFRQIGDLEGARDLLDEVIAKAGGTLRAKAQAMLDTLG